MTAGDGSARGDNAWVAYQRGDHAKAYRLWSPLAARGNAAAQFNLGVLYERGHGVRQDFVQAPVWFGKAARQGHASVQNNLGILCRRGRDVPQDYAKALSWFRKSAAQGNAQAMNSLGRMYYKGQGVSVDDVEAYKWFNLAAARAGNEILRREATRNLALVTVNMTPAQVLRAQRLTGAWRPDLLSDEPWPRLDRIRPGQPAPAAPAQ